MSQTEIELMGPETICSFRGRTGDGAMAETQRCDIVWNDGERTRGFLKCFSADHHLGVVNEITGYILSRACGLPVPRRAGIVALSQTLVDGLDIRGCQAGIYRYAFAISEAPGKTPNTLFDGLNDYAKAILTRELLDGWHGLSPLLAFDDWSANQDRNLGNFLIDDKKSVYIIDHSNYLSISSGRLTCCKPVEVIMPTSCTSS
nr:hypothetical protein [uncultured Halomonas sp.]